MGRARIPFVIIPGHFNREGAKLRLVPALRDVRTLLDAWAATSMERDIERASDLYLRDPQPLVTFTDGERAQDWLDVRVRLARDLGRVAIERVEVHDVAVRDLGDDLLAATFDYDMHVRDVWGTPTVAHRRASMTLARTKDGLRIAAAHFSHA